MRQDHIHTLQLAYTDDRLDNLTPEQRGKVVEAMKKAAGEAVTQIACPWRSKVGSQLIGDGLSISVPIDDLTDAQAHTLHQAVNQAIERTRASFADPTLTASPITADEVMRMGGPVPITCPADQWLNVDLLLHGLMLTEAQRMLFAANALTALLKVKQEMFPR